MHELITGSPPEMQCMAENQGIVLEQPFVEPDHVVIGLESFLGGSVLLYTLSLARKDRAAP